MIFKKFDSTDIVVGRVNQVSSPMWTSGDIAALQSAFYTSPTQTVATGSGIFNVYNGLYYNNVYYSGEPFFSVAYGNYYGSGSSQTDIDTSKIYPTKAIYSEYANVLLPSTQKIFTFATASTVTANSTTTITGSSIYAISFTVNKYKDKLDEGQIEFSLSGSNGQFTFIDDSSVTGKIADSYNIISGSIVNGIPTPYTNGGKVTALYYGIGTLYPKTGTIILNSEKVSSLTGITDFTGTNPTSYGLYQKKLIDGITKCTTKYFKARKSEFLPSKHYFVRVKNQEFNYSNNPSFVSDGTDGKQAGTIRFNQFFTNPQSYITTVGLYNDSNELVAVAKLSQPVMKSFDNESLIKVRLDF
jgi:hypothetical protein